MELIDSHLLQITVIGLAGFAAQWVAWKWRLPAIIFLLAIGFIFGPMLGIIRPQALMGDMLSSVIAVSVAVILFEASLNLNFREIRELQRGVRHLVLIGAPVMWLLTSYGSYYIGGLSWPVSVVFAGLLVVTGPTVIIPLLRAAHLAPRVSSLLKWEGIINDPVGILFTIIAFEYFVYSTNHGTIDSAFYIGFIFTLAAICVLSASMGFLTAFVLRRGFVPEYLKAYFLFISVIALFAFANAVKDEAGLIAVTVMGITLGNCNIAGLDQIRRFKETVTLLLISGVFILLTADLDPSLLLKIDIRGLLFILAIMLVFRPVAVFLSSVGTSIKFKEAVFISLIAPRGVVCAAVAGIMGPLLVQNGFSDGDKILPLAFGLVVLTVVIHSLSAKFLAKKLKLYEESINGLIIVGASAWTLDLAKTLKEKNVQVLITDSNWYHLRPVRLANLPFYYGEILSDEAEFKINHNNYGALLAATDNHAYNALLCSAFAPDFGHERVWQLAAPQDTGSDNKKIAHKVQGKIFVGADLTYDEWWRRNIHGQHFKATNVGSEEKGATETGILANPESLKIGIIRNGKLQFKSSDLNISAKEGDVLLWLNSEKN